MKKNYVSIFLAVSSGLFLILFSSSCATILSSSNQRIEITTQKENAILYFNGNKIDSIPYILLIKKKYLSKDSLKHGVQLKFLTENGEAREIHLKRKINPIYWSNIFLIGFPGLLIDFLTGKMWLLKPAKVKL